MSSDPTIQMLIILLGCIVFIVFVLLVVYFVMKFKSKPKKEEEEGEEKQEETKQGLPPGKQSIFNFMEFESIEDNMIIQKKNRKYIMVVECQGINYDLMSGVEKNSVELGFVQFLNTLRYPIQLYIQTRTINLESSISEYKKRVDKIGSKLFMMQQQYNEMLESGNYKPEDLNAYLYEITKQNNLYEYGRDIIYDTEKMSLNKDILTKKYYIVIPYYPVDIREELDDDEIKAMAFSELYTRSQSIIRSISACSVNGKILNSLELGELLYMAYNRDDSEILNIQNALKSGFNEMYTTAPDVLDKRMKELDKAVEQKALEIAQKSIEKAQNNKKYMDAKKKEQELDELAKEMAQVILEENRQYVDGEIIDMAKQEITNEDKGGKEDVQEKKTRGRKKKASSK